MTRRVVSLVLLSLAAAGATTAVARADGLPVLGVDVGASGVLSAAGDARYVTIPSGHATVLARVRTSGGQVVASRVLRGRFTVPAVAYDGSASGLAADGHTLVLIEPRVSFPRTWTRLLVVDAKRLRPRQLLRLHGDFSFDAISPRGSLVYLIQYVAPNDPNRYLVRAYNLATGRLLPRPIVDSREPDEQMRGRPLTRVASPGARWAYTLYDGAGDAPFVHALDTSTGSARCIDLEMLPRRDLWQLRLSLDRAGRTLTVSARQQRLVSIDTRSFRVAAVE